MIEFFKKLLGIKDKINYRDCPCGGIHRCPKCGEQMMILALEGMYDPYMRPINTSTCIECGYEVDHVTDWENKILQRKVNNAV